MKTWFYRFGISAACDKGKTLPRWLSQRLSGCEELRGFAGQVSELDSALRRPAPSESPATLHASIMGAVHASHRAGNAPRKWTRLRWLPVPAAAVLALCASFWLLIPHPSRTVPSLTDAFQIGEQIGDMFPVQLVDPLNEEWQRVNLDLENTTRFLLAAVPF